MVIYLLTETTTIIDCEVPFYVFATGLDLSVYFFVKVWKIVSITSSTENLEKLFEKTKQSSSFFITLEHITNMSI